MKKIEVGKSYKTRDGRKVRIYTLDGLGAHAIHGAIFYVFGGWNPYSWSKDGSHIVGEDSDCDVVLPWNETEGTEES